MNFDKIRQVRESRMNKKKRPRRTRYRSENKPSRWKAIASAILLK